MVIIDQVSNKLLAVELAQNVAVEMANSATSYQSTMFSTPDLSTAEKARKDCNRRIPFNV
jgi:hypothetical protein